MTIALVSNVGKIFQGYEGLIIGERFIAYKETLDFTIENPPKRTRDITHITTGDVLLNKKTATEVDGKMSSFHI